MYWVADERNSACAVDEIATCDQNTGDCACIPIAPVERWRR
jgi:hypothetical protein